jgi:predicted nuclease of restriction endonuclease-like (RecB) superfamily
MLQPIRTVAHLWSVALRKSIPGTIGFMRLEAKVIKHEMNREHNPPLQQTPDLSALLSSLRGLIQEARRHALRQLDAGQVRTCWEIGRHIVEFEQGGTVRAEYGKRLLETLARDLASEFGRGFDISNLRYMRLFYQAFPIRDALRHELSWTHYRLLLKLDSEPARQWYMTEAAAQNWSTRALDRQINTLYYERLLSTSDRAAVQQEAQANLSPSEHSPREFVRDPVMLEFLGIPGTGRLLEADLEQALLDNLQAFLLELGKGFAFVARQYRISTESKDFYIDMVFYNYLLKCFVLFDLKTGELTHQDIGQMDMYVRMMDEIKRNGDDNPTVGIILCTHKDVSVVHYSILQNSEQLFASKYKLVLPSEEELRVELERERHHLTQQQRLELANE